MVEKSPMVMSAPVGSSPISASTPVFLGVLPTFCQPSIAGAVSSSAVALATPSSSRIASVFPPGGEPTIMPHSGSPSVSVAETATASANTMWSRSPSTQPLSCPRSRSSLALSAWPSPSEVGR